MKIYWSIIGACIATTFVSAQAAAPSAEVVAAGEKISVACQACHGGDGMSVNPDIPNLAGQKATYLTEQLTSFKSGDRKHDIMNPIAKQLSLTDIQGLAAFFSGLPAGGSQREAASAALAARGSDMKFPAEFPRGFSVYKTDGDPEAKTVQQSYVNDVAREAARKGQHLPNGSVIIVATTKAKLDASGKPMLDSAGNLQPGEAASFSGMEIRAGAGAQYPELLRNGDWIYALFDAKRTRVDKFNYAKCLACHKPAANSDYVFTLKDLAGDRAGVK